MFVNGLLGRVFVFNIVSEPYICFLIIYILLLLTQYLDR